MSQGNLTFHNGNVTGDFAYTAEHFHHSVSLDEKKQAFITSNELSRVTCLLIIYFFMLNFIRSILLLNM